MEDEDKKGDSQREEYKGPNIIYNEDALSSADSTIHKYGSPTQGTHSSIHKVHNQSGVQKTKTKKTASVVTKRTEKPKTQTQRLPRNETETSQKKERDLSNQMEQVIQ